jgi:MFS transporter, OFA family, oxalate/formate antiporter
VTSGMSTQLVGVKERVPLLKIIQTERTAQLLLPIPVNDVLSINLLRGAACILGGAMAHFTFGSVYCWGNFNSYAPHELRSDYIFPLSVVAQCLTMPFGPVITRILGARKTLLVGCWIMASGVYFSSFAKTLPTFVFCYSIMVGCGVGIAYASPMIAGWSWLPNSKGLVSGAILTGFGLGGFVFNLVGSSIVNPRGIDPVHGQFPPEIYRQFPHMLRTLAVTYASISFCGCLLITEHPKITVVNDDDFEYENGKGKEKRTLSAEILGVTIKEALRTSQFWLMWAMIITSASAGLNVASMYKQFASISPQLKGDSYQALTGGMGALFNGFGRLFWGSICDRIGFKASFTILTVAQALVQLLYPYSPSSKVRPISYLIPHTSYLIPHTSYLIPHTLSVLDMMDQHCIKSIF